MAKDIVMNKGDSTIKISVAKETEKIIKDLKKTKE